MTSSHVIELNSKSVALMKKQQFQKAIVVASNALKYHRELHRSEKEDTSTHNGFIDKYMLHDDVDEPSNSCTDGFIYQRGISIPSDAPDTVEITPILIFNLALSHQLLAQQQEEGTKKLFLLDKAKRLYELVCNSYDTSECVLFEFAIINNTAVIHKALGNDDMSKAYLEHLMSLMMMFVDSGSNIQLRQMNGFLANMNSRETAPAA